MHNLLAGNKFAALSGLSPSSSQSSSPSSSRSSSPLARKPSHLPNKKNRETPWAPPRKPSTSEPPFHDRKVNPRFRYQRNTSPIEQFSLDPHENKNIRPPGLRRGRGKEPTSENRGHSIVDRHLGDACESPPRQRRGNSVKRDSSPSPRLTSDRKAASSLPGQHPSTFVPLIGDK